MVHREHHAILNRALMGFALGSVSSTLATVGEPAGGSGSGGEDPGGRSFHHTDERQWEY